MNQVWINVESGGFMHTVPTPDLHPHGTMVDGDPLKYLLTATCACNPDVVSMRDGMFLEPPHAIHHSFRDAEEIKKAMQDPKTL